MVIMKRKNYFTLIVLRGCIVLALIGLSISIYAYYTSKESYEIARNTYSTISAQYVDNDSDKINNIDFKNLLQINNNIVGWIKSDDSIINYAIVQGNDNDYYLTHMIDNSYNKAGAIFMDYTNSSDFSDQNTIIYGHNMKDGSMFAYLLNYKDQAFYDKHPSMYLYTIDSIYKIDIIAGIIISGDEDYLKTKFINNDDKINYVNSLIVFSTFLSTTKISPDDLLITLSTCSYDFQDARYVLFGKLTTLETQ